MPVAAGTVLLFESWLRHEVPPNPVNDRTREHQLQLQLVLRDIERTASAPACRGGSVSDRIPIPRDPANDYTADMAQRRREFVTGRTGTALTHVGSFTVDPAQVAGNIENFLGVAQVPIGLAGPLRINGEHATGDFYVPLATTEGTLVASYNRGMRLLSESGGVTVTVVKRSMQRAPVFEFAERA